MMEMGSEPEAEEEMAPELESEPAMEEPAGDFDAFADIALDASLPMSERRQAFKEAIMACMSSDYESEESGEEKSALASIFGG